MVVNGSIELSALTILLQRQEAMVDRQSDAYLPRARCNGKGSRTSLCCDNRAAIGVSDVEASF